jgi:hypothetical protein
MVNPKTEKDLLSLIREVNSELDNLSMHLNQTAYRCEQDRDSNKNN